MFKNFDKFDTFGDDVLTVSKFYLTDSTSSNVNNFNIVNTPQKDSAAEVNRSVQ